MVLWAWKWSIHHLAQSSKMKRWPFLSLLASKKYPITLTYWHGGGRQLIFTISQHCEFISSGTEMKMETPHLVCEEKPIFSRHCCVMVHWDLSSSGCSFSALGVWLPLPRGVSQEIPKDPIWKLQHTGFFHSHSVKHYFLLSELLPACNSFCSPTRHITITQQALEMLQWLFLHHG